MKVTFSIDDVRLLLVLVLVPKSVDWKKPMSALRVLQVVDGRAWRTRYLDSSFSWEVDTIVSAVYDRLLSPQ